MSRETIQFDNTTPFENWQIGYQNIMAKKREHPLNMANFGVSMFTGAICLK